VVDELGLSKALAGRLLMLLVAAMVVLAALGVGGGVAAWSLAREWRQGAASALMIEVPQPSERLKSETRVGRVLALLQADPQVGSAHLLTQDELSTLLRPWLGGDVAALGLELPAMIEVHLVDPGVQGAGLGAGALVTKLQQSVPGTIAEASDDWSARLLALGRSLAACAGVAVVLVLSVAVALVALAASAGLSAQRETIEILHLLGATDGDVANRFARRLGLLTLVGGIAGALVALPLLVELANLAAPFGVAPSDDVAAQPLSMLTTLPPAIWTGLAALPFAAAGIGWITAQLTVRVWLRRLP